MILQLFIENYALIRKLDIRLSEGLSVITGETGAGKSIILGAMGLILGQRADTSVLLDKSSKCVVEGTFNLKGLRLEAFFEKHDIDYDDLCLLRREINPSGKSRAFINDTPVNLPVMKDLGDILVDIHSQHEQLLAGDAWFQMEVLDHYAGHRDVLDTYGSIYTKMRDSEKSLTAMLELEKQSKLDQGYYQYLLDELDSVKPLEGEQQRLEEELEVLIHAEEIKSSLYKACQVMNHDDSSLLGNAHELSNALNHAARFHSGLKDLVSHLDSVIIELKDLASDLERAEESAVFDPEHAEQINIRLHQLYSLEKKHRVSSVEELLSLREEISSKLLDIGSLEEDIRKTEEELSQMKSELTGIAEIISEGRRGVVPQVEAQLAELLTQMGMPAARLKVMLGREQDFGPAGTDKVRFLFSANKGSELHDIDRVASGGELSRLLLALKTMISRKKLLPTLIFDEIDLGISGEVADKAGNLLRKLSKERQVLVITHLPQIASKGDQHFFVYKEEEDDRTQTHIRILDPDERIAEIAKMISGDTVTRAALETARELLEQN